MLVDVVFLIGRGKHLGFVDVIDAELLQNLRLCKVADAGLGHHRNVDRAHHFLDDLGRGHAGHAALGPNHGGDAFQSHYGSRAGLLGDLRLLGAHDVHNDAALEHLREAYFQSQSVAIGIRHADFSLQIQELSLAHRQTDADKPECAEAVERTIILARSGEAVLSKIIGPAFVLSWHMRSLLLN